MRGTSQVTTAFSLAWAGPPRASSPRPTSRGWSHHTFLRKEGAEHRCAHRPTGGRAGWQWEEAETPGRDGARRRAPTPATGSGTEPLPAPPRRIPLGAAGTPVDAEGQTSVALRAAATAGAPGKGGPGDAGSAGRSPLHPHPQRSPTRSPSGVGELPTLEPWRGGAAGRRKAHAKVRKRKRPPSPRPPGPPCLMFSTVRPPWRQQADDRGHRRGREAGSAVQADLAVKGRMASAAPAAAAAAAPRSATATAP